MFVYSIGVNAQCYEDSIVFIQNKPFETFKFKQVNLYNNQNKLDQIYYLELINHSDTNSFRKDTFSYDYALNKTTLIKKEFNKYTRKWQLNNKTETYSTLENYYHYNIDSSKFLHSGRNYYTINTSNFKEYILQNFNFNSQKFENSFRRLYLFENEMLSELIYQNWNNNNSVFSNTSKIKYTYLNGLLIADTSFIVNPSSFEFEKSNYNVYLKNINNQDSVKIYYSKFNVLQAKTFYTYYPNRCVFQEKNYSYQGTTIIDSSINTHYINQKLTRINTTNITPINVYPNPSHSEINVINAKGDYRIIEISSGKEIMKGTIINENEVIDISLLKSGVYLFKTKNQIQKLIKY